MKPGWKVLGGAGLALGLWLAGPRVLRTLEFFRVRQVEVRGARYLAADELVRALDLPEGMSLFDPRDALAPRLIRIIGVAEAEVHRKWPGTLVVTIREREPVALVPKDGVLALMDGRGWVLPFDPTRNPTSLPVAEHDTVVARVLARVREVDPALFREVTRAAREGGKDRVVLEAGGRRLLLAPEATVEAIEALSAVRRDLEQDGRSYRELDARFHNRVFVRGMSS